MSTTRVTDYLDLLECIQAILERHPDGRRVSLMLRPPGSELGADEVLLARRTGGELELQPHRVAGAPPQGSHASPGRDATEIQAAIALATALWATVERHGGPSPARPDPVHIRRLFDPAMLTALRVPVGEDRPASQTVALADHGLSFERPGDDAALKSAYERRPRTRVYEGADVRADGPFALAALLLSHRARCRVVCTFYESTAGDATLGEHGDHWHGVIVQLDGAKRWCIRTDPSADPTSLLLEAGDVLLLPRGVPHDVATPDRSLHAVFAILTHEPI